MTFEACQRVQRFRIAGEKSLHDQGISLDRALIAEIDSPGADQRYGVNLIARPPSSIVDGIEAIQEALRSAEPDQYYYPSCDLHLTLLEICSGRTWPEAKEIATKILEKVGTPTWDLAPRLDSPVLVFNDSACAVNFIPVSGALVNNREALIAQMGSNGIVVDTRHPPQAAHITFLRYTAPLRTSVHEWAKMLRGVNLDPSISWDVDSMWLTWGATWYGRSSRIQSAGPYLTSEKSS